MATTDDSETVGKTNSENSANGNGANGNTRAAPRSVVTYPFFPVQEGLKVAEAIQRAGGSEATQPEVMKAMGLTSMQSHAWSYRISTAREFGLVERVGRGDDAKLRVTELFMAYAHPGSDSEKRAALMQIVLKPTIYAKLLARYRGAPKPDVKGIANVLWREEKLLESVKDQAAEAFLSTVEFAGLIANGVVNSVSSATGPAIGTGFVNAVFQSGASVAAPMDAAPPEEKDVKPSTDASPPPPPGMQNVAVPDTFVVYTCKFGKGRFIQVPLPRDFTAADVDRLYAFLKTQIDDE